MSMLGKLHITWGDTAGSDLATQAQRKLDQALEKVSRDGALTHGLGVYPFDEFELIRRRAFAAISASDQPQAVVDQIKQTLGGLEKPETYSYWGGYGYGDYTVQWGRKSYAELENQLDGFAAARRIALDGQGD